MLFIAGINGRSARAQNLLNLVNWTIGQGSAGMFGYIGASQDNNREWGEGPQGSRVIVWKAQPNGINLDNGGWNSGDFSIDHTSLYRFSVWIKKTNNKDIGITYFGCSNGGNILSLQGEVDTNPYFWNGQLPVLDKWYLLIGYIHGSGDTSTESFGGVYDPITGTKLFNGTDFKFLVGTQQTAHRAYLFYDTNLNNRQYFYAPRVDVVNGNEPSIESLLGLSRVSTLAYFPDKVGIKTRNVGDYELAVNGKVRAQEIKVESSNWPDYVFAKDYEFPSLKETEQHIRERGHLPGIPSASDVKEKGIDLGDMNAKLLKKIEELTLLLIKQNERIESLETKNEKSK